VAVAVHLHDFFNQWWPVIFGSSGTGIVGALAHPGTRSLLRRAYVAVTDAPALVAENVDLSRQLADQQRRAHFWEESHAELTRQLDDLSQRFQQIRTLADNAVVEVATLRAKMLQHQHLVVDLCADRDALLIWGRSMANVLGPSAPAEPVLRQSSFTMTLPSDTP